MTDIASTIAEKQVELDKMFADYTLRVRDEFTKITSFFFEATGLQVVIWDQYIPTFNDGDPCNFTIGEVTFVRENFDPEDLMSASEYEAGHYNSVSTWSTSTDPLKDACKAFNSFIHRNKNIVEELFFKDDEYGNTVFLTKDRHYSIDYDCGY